VRAASKSAATDVPPPPARQANELAPETDPLSEADIYLAYGRYQQAEELIKEAMHHDRNPALRFKLLEIYYASRNSTGFEDAARDLRHEVGADHALWQQVMPMGRELCPYSLLFNPDQGTEDLGPGATDATVVSAAPSVTVPDSYDFDLGQTEETAPTAPETGRDRFSSAPPSI